MRIVCVSASASSRPRKNATVRTTVLVGVRKHLSRNAQGAQRTGRAIALRALNVCPDIPVRDVAGPSAVQRLPGGTHTRARVGVVREMVIPP